MPADPADSVPPPADVEAVARTRRRRRRGGLAAAGLVLALLGAGIVAGAAWRTRSTDDAHRPTAPPRSWWPALAVPFTPLEPLGPGIPVRGDLLGGPAMAVIGDRAVFTTYLTERATTFGGSNAAHIFVGAVDLTTGKQAWPLRDIGPILPVGLSAYGDSVMVVGDRFEGGGRQRVAMVFDPADGALRWQANLDADTYYVHESVVVLTSTAKHVMRVLDLRTGAEKWRVSLRPATIVQSLGMLTPAKNPSGGDLRGPAAGYLDHRWLQLYGDGAVEVYDLRSGALLSTRTHAIEPSDGKSYPWNHVAYDGKLYGRRFVEPGELRLYDLDRTDGPHTIYTAPSGSGSVSNPTPCGTGRICVLTGSRDKAELVSIDVTNRRELWRRPAAHAQYLTAVGDRIVTSNGKLFDLDGRQLLDPGYENAASLWVDRGSLLLLSLPPTVSPGIAPDVEVVGLSTADGTRVPLGRLPKTYVSCAWTTRILVCPTDKAIQAWRFAR